MNKIKCLNDLEADLYSDTPYEPTDEDLEFHYQQYLKDLGEEGQYGLR